MENTTYSGSSSHSDTNPIGPIGNKQLNPIGPIEPIATNDYSTVELLLSDYSDLILANYKPWFAKRFYRIKRELIVQAASIARQDGKDTQSYFTHLIKKLSNA